MNNDDFGHEWGDSPIMFTSDAVTSENYLQFKYASLVKIICNLNKVLKYYLDNTPLSWPQ